jgi:hypothetical protein
LVDLETGLQANRICAGKQKVQREGLMQRSGKGLDVGKFLSFISTLTEMYKSLKILGLKMH